MVAPLHPNFKKAMKENALRRHPNAADDQLEAEIDEYQGLISVRMTHEPGTSPKTDEQRIAELWDKFKPDGPC